MVAIKILFFVSAAAALAIKLDTSTILSDVSTVDYSAEALTRTVNNYQSGVLAAVPASGILY